MQVFFYHFHQSFGDFFFIDTKDQSFSSFIKGGFYTYTYSCNGNHNYASRLLELASQKKGNGNSMLHDTSCDTAYKLDSQHHNFITQAFQFTLSKRHLQSLTYKLIHRYHLIGLRPLKIKSSICRL